MFKTLKHIIGMTNQIHFYLLNMLKLLFRTRIKKYIYFYGNQNLPKVFFTIKVFLAQFCPHFFVPNL